MHANTLTLTRLATTGGVLLLGVVSCYWGCLGNNSCSPLALSGMETIGVSNGVPVLRPLLSHAKDDIFAFAHRYGVPYFKGW